MRASRYRLAGVIAAILMLVAGAAAAEPLKELRVDWATYNPVSIVLKDKGWLEESVKADGTKVVWVQSLGSNKALEFMNAGSLDFGSTAGAAALLARINGNPVKAIYVYSRPEWTALVTRADTGITAIDDLKGKRVAATRGTDPHIFLIRALQTRGLTDKDIKLVLLQHQDGRLALVNGDVDAWAGLDPLMAQAELDSGAKLFYRNPDVNTWGVLNVREAFAAEHPQVVAAVLAAYERARAHALAHPDGLRAAIAAAAKISEPVAARQLERTQLTHSAIGEPQRAAIETAGLALQQAGIIAAGVDVPKLTAALIDPSFSAKLAQK